MKTYKRHRTLEEVQALCDEQGVELRRQLFDEGNDFVSLHSQGGITLYDPTLGRFQGVQVGVSFNSSQDRGEPWFLALLNFFYTNEEPPK